MAILSDGFFLLRELMVRGGVRAPLLLAASFTRGEWSVVAIVHNPIQSNPSQQTNSLGRG
jgi:hypothetical protein